MNLFSKVSVSRRIDVDNRIGSSYNMFGQIIGYYKYCCVGVYCPDCPLELNISGLGQNLTVNSAVSLSCVNTSFEVVFNTIGQPGNFNVKVRSSHLIGDHHLSDDSHYNYGNKFTRNHAILICKIWQEYES